MDSLYSRSEETFAMSLISSVPLDRLIIALAHVTSVVLSAPGIPSSLRSQVLLRALRILQDIEHERNLLDLCFAKFVPHPSCAEKCIILGELWGLPREHEWLCEECGKPLYIIENTDG
ncbi:jg3556 [Pararge aegeria aegeria]|uniref:Jg3556 protein n=1 Tax=Pararge aegeria aegeria TaxID=348720 RepID=A0A8S4QDC1_9NEOP|nr:jg3556 [Pararge aegeria aegeria]